MVKTKFLYTINKTELEEATEIISLERINIIKFWQIIDDQLKPPQSLLYFKQPKLEAYPLVLNVKVYINTQGIAQTDCMAMLEKFIIEENLYNAYKSHGNGRRIKIFTRRHVLTRILTAPFFITDLPIIVTKHKNFIFMATFQDSGETTTNGRHHYKFAQYCETISPAAEPNINEAVHDNKRGFCVYSATYGHLDMFYTGQAYPVASEENIENFADLESLNKCTFVSTNIMHESKFDFWQNTVTAFQWWVKAYVCNAKQIFVGFKNTEGVVCKPGLLKDIDYLETQQSSRIHVGKTFMFKFLNLIMETTKNYDCPDTIIKYHFDRAGNITYSVHNSEEFSMFSADFLDYMRSHN
ncbi:uncharacterized protein LOC105665261 isoform X1 [Ceratitis capitata]|uniref:uncharacterized protein LOC105665261 isoform X1 n=1 Tax=Ceratitis capitata TaxID=7213 RepID=UPI000A108D92|nr:uncharacterized protein LOC105665261 isoform X1 [Ceratitis capitata]